MKQIRHCIQLLPEKKLDGIAPLLPLLSPIFIFYQFLIIRIKFIHAFLLLD